MILPFRQREQSAKGFSLLELLIVVAVILISTAVITMNLGRSLKSSHVNTAVQIVVSNLRQARERAMDGRTLYVVTFTAPRTILTQTIVGGNPPQTVRTIDLPKDVQFDAETGIPTAAKTPNGFGIGNLAIDFDQGNGGAPNVIYFYPDGTALDGAGNPNNGVVYIATPGILSSSHAVTLFGATGQIKVWSLAGNSGALKWQ